MKLEIFLILLCVSFARAAEVVTDRSVDGFVETYVTNLPTTIRVANGVLTFEDHGTNLWTSTESHDWGSWLPNGSRNPAPGEAIALNMPLTMQPVGTEWAVAGGFSVLALSPGVSMTAIGSDASVSWTFPDGSSWKWLAESQIDVPAVAKSITVEDQDGVEVVLIDYAVAEDAAALTMLRSATYAGSYSVETNVVWTQVSSTTRRATIPTGGDVTGFFRARVSDSIPAHIEASCPIYAKSGIMTGSSDVNPVVYDSTIELEVDGVRYRLAAERVD